MNEFNLSELSKRERQVLAMMVEGHRSADIAAAFFRSQKTIACHKARIKEKLGIKTPVQWMALLRQFSQVVA